MRFLAVATGKGAIAPFTKSVLVINSLAGQSSGNIQAKSGTFPEMSKLLYKRNNFVIISYSSQK
jgi:hypothetical protein